MKKFILLFLSFLLFFLFQTNFLAIAVAEGTLKWAFQTSGAMTSSPAIGVDGTIYVGADKIYAINPDGTEKWTFQTGGTVYSSPAIVADGTIYVGAGLDDAKFHAINPDGTQKWTFQTEHPIWGDAAIGVDGTIYVGAGKTYAINPDGTQKWAFPGLWVPTCGTYPAIGADGTIYVKSWERVGIEEHPVFYAINPDGTEIWVLETGYEIRSSPAIGADGTIYVGGSDNRLHAINPDGTEKWAFKGEPYGNVDMSPTIAADGTIYVGAMSGVGPLYAINPDGTEKWTFPIVCTTSSPAIGADGTIYVGSFERKIYAINPDGTEKWTFQTGGTVYSSPAIVADGTIYVGSYNDRTLYAISSSSFGLANSAWPMYRHDIRHTGRSEPFATIHVPGDYLTIQEGIDAANDGDTVLVADNTWTGEGNKNLDFGGKAITVRSENGPDNCIIDCEDDGRGFYFHNNEGEDSMVSGFTIINGSLALIIDSYGGAIYNDDGSTPTITNCTFLGNSNYYGGAIYNRLSSPTITNCTFSGNHAFEFGGAIYNDDGSTPTITNCTFSGNTSFHGGAISNLLSSPTITNCTFSGNRASGVGGAICNYNSSSPTITNCTFSGNSTSQNGGAIYSASFSSSTITNCTFSGNRASGVGGAIINYYFSSPTITNCILWADSPGEIFNRDDSDPIVTFSDIEGGYPGEGNIDADPLFHVNYVVGDTVVAVPSYHLQPNSSCIDAGTSENAPDDDIDGDERPWGAGFDMGADEYIPPEEYWTPERMRNAIGCPMPEFDEESEAEQNMPEDANPGFKTESLLQN